MAGGAVLIAWAVDRCERCMFAESAPIRFSRIPRGIAELNLSGQWQSDDSYRISSHTDENEDTYYHLEFRRVRADGDAFLMAWRATFYRKFDSEIRRDGPISPNKWLLSVSRNAEPMQPVILRAGTEDQWQQGVPMQRRAAEWYWPPPFEVLADGAEVHLLDSNGARLPGKDFQPTVGVMWGPPALSAGQRWLTVVGLNAWIPGGGGGAAGTIDFSGILIHPTHYFSISTYNCASGHLISEVRGWGCGGELILRGEPTWYDDDLMVVDLGSMRTLIYRPPDTKG